MGRGIRGFSVPPPSSSPFSSLSSSSSSSSPSPLAPTSRKRSRSIDGATDQSPSKRVATDKSDPDFYAEGPITALSGMSRFSSSSRPSHPKAQAPKPAKAQLESQQKGRPARCRKAPARLADEQAAAPKKAAKSKAFEPSYMTTNSKSRLVRADLYHLLLKDEAWDCLLASEKTALLAMLPPTSANLTIMTKITDGDQSIPRPRELSSGDIFRTDVAKYQSDLAGGKLSKAWLASAGQAMVKRANGDFDDWKAAETEIWWGQQSV